jgi:hypothetical protein
MILNLGMSSGASCVGVGIQHSRSRTMSESPAHACGPNSGTMILRKLIAPPIVDPIKGEKVKKPAVVVNLSEPQATTHSLESAIVLRNVHMSLTELRQTLHTSHRVPPEKSSIAPNQCLLVEGYRMRRRYLAHWRGPKGEVVPVDASGAQEHLISGSTQLASPASGASSSSPNHRTEGDFGNVPLNERSIVGNSAEQSPDAAVEVLTLGDEDQCTVVCITHCSGTASGDD